MEMFLSIKKDIFQKYIHKVFTLKFYRNLFKFTPLRQINSVIKKKSYLHKLSIKIIYHICNYTHAYLRAHAQRHTHSHTYVHAFTHAFTHTQTLTQTLSFNHEDFYFSRKRMLNFFPSTFFENLFFNHFKLKIYLFLISNKADCIISLLLLSHQLGIENQKLAFFFFKTLFILNPPSYIFK